MRGDRRAGRVPARLFAAVLAVVVLLGAGAAAVRSITNREIVARLPVPREAPLDERHASVARGARLAAELRCASCHAADLGGQYAVRNPAVAMLWGPNLTRGDGGVGTRYSDADYARAIRRGLRPTGMRLLLMPSWDYARLSDADVASLIAYVRSVPPVDRHAPAFHLGPVGRVLLLAHRLRFGSDQ